MTEIIEANFSQIKIILEKHKNDVINAITKEKNHEIQELKNEIKEKESIICNLKQKEGQLEGKDEVIATLKHNID